MDHYKSPDKIENVTVGHIFSHRLHNDMVRQVIEESTQCLVVADTKDVS